MLNIITRTTVYLIGKKHRSKNTQPMLYTHCYILDHGKKCNQKNVLDVLGPKSKISNNQMEKRSTKISLYTSGMVYIFQRQPSKKLFTKLNSEIILLVMLTDYFKNNNINLRSHNYIIYIRCLKLIFLCQLILP